MSRDLELRLRLTATDQGVAGTVQKTERQVDKLSDALDETSRASKGAAQAQSTMVTAGSEAARVLDSEADQAKSLTETLVTASTASRGAAKAQSTIVTAGSEAAKVLDLEADHAKDLTSSLTGVTNAARAQQAAQASTVTAGTEANRMFRLQKGALQQAGYQFQDFFVQVGSGTSAFVALGQQGSQLLGILGPGGALMGAVLAIGSVIGGSFVAAMGDGEDAIKAMDAAVKALDETIEQSDGVPELTRQIRDLARESEVAARARISSALLAAEDAAKSAARGIGEAFGDLDISDMFGLKDLETFTESLGTFEAYLLTGYIKDELQELGEMFGLSGDRAQQAGREIGQLLAQLRSNPSFENFSALEEAMAQFAAEGGQPSEAMTRFIGTLGTYFDTARDAGERTEALKAALEDLSGSIRTKGAGEIDKLIEKLQVQAETLGMNTLEMIEYNRQVDLAAAREAKAGDEKTKLINKYYDQIYLHEQRSIAAKKEADAQDELNRTQKAYSQSVQRLVDELDPLGAQFESVYDKQQLLIQAAADGKISEGYRDVLITNLVEGMADAGEEAAEAFTNPFEQSAARVSQAVQNAIASGEWDTIGDAIGNTLASSISSIIDTSITQSLSKDLTASSGIGQQLAVAFAGPLVGAVAGGVIQLAMRELDDYFSDDWDPTAARQASQGTGTVLGDINAKSESIRRAVEGSESGIGQLVGINQSMLAALQNVQAGISGASTRIARGASGIDISAPSVMSGSDLFGDVTGGAFPIFDQTLEWAFDFTDTIQNILTLGLVDLGDLLGGKTKFVDEGVRIIGGTLDDLMSQTIVQAYNTYRAKKHAFDDYDTYEKFQTLGSEVGTQFSLVFESLFDSVLSGADALGINAAGRLSNARIGTRKLSLEGLSADQKQAELEAYFGSVFDKLAKVAVPFLDEFQDAGEGLGETLSRVAGYVLVTDEAVNRLGIQFTNLSGRQLVAASERLLEAAGGVDQFINSMQGFIGNFASEAQKFEIAYSDISRALEQSNLQLPATREGYYELLQAQNGATEAGAQNIATLLNLQSAADEYYTFLEDAQTSVFESQIDLLEVQRSTYSDALREAEQASESVARALSGLSVTGTQFAQASRESALATLQDMVATGRVGSQDQLDSALATATSIQASEFSTMADYIRSVSRTGNTLNQLQSLTDSRVTREQRLLENIERRIETMSAEMAAIGSATAKHTAKTAKLLERIEVSGLEIRE